MSHSTVAKLHALVDEYEALARSLRENHNNFVECACDLEEIEADDELAAVDSAFKETLKEEQTLLVNAATLRDIAEDTIATNTTSIDVYEQQCKERLAMALRRCGHEFSRSEPYKDFRQKIWEVKHPDQIMPPLSTAAYNDEEEEEDDDIIEMAQHVSLICPLTTMIMEDPVTSASCKHSFSKRAIVEYIQRYQGSERAPCPVTGCSRMIVESDLVRNRWLERKILRESEMREQRVRVDSEHAY
ncbi:zinc-finger of the MIZ type in Nse subunit-domain-containing protein [Syncephalis pseudoplumigaleata]|uniref:Zinc-finger of the MIZ type in Nse subunit-domain-containing protein n=1 Tax=Syncephalis pseudoplumigaleata TaxID=1712513 RepID=A0A4P9Z4T6_9FUNG|nr:zinc-finger of the MIZ type in Nse subunit-domain-containing protein [Syncephalis pseudoplumigaleata]|eukprot:RKP27526.1 zinc-finger of the MIZ type in Nse subunit-domain-containing protein [Syncephalis pseudoplumigaleata]